ncbi:hypothetical protein YC2023_088733 [Brassica napus]
MIEASDFGESGAAKGANEKALTRNMTRSVCPEPQQGNQRRASPRINPKQVQQPMFPIFVNSHGSEDLDVKDVNLFK